MCFFKSPYSEHWVVFWAVCVSQFGMGWRKISSSIRVSPHEICTDLVTSFGSSRLDPRSHLWKRKSLEYWSNNVKLSKNMKIVTYHHQMSIFAFINHRLLANTKVHTALLPCLDLKLYAVRRSNVNMLFPIEQLETGWKISDVCLFTFPEQPWCYSACLQS